MKFIITLCLTFSTYIVAQEPQLPGWGIYVGGAFGGATSVDDLPDGHSLESRLIAPNIGVSKGMFLGGVPLIVGAGYHPRGYTYRYSNPFTGSKDDIEAQVNMLDVWASVPYPIGDRAILQAGFLLGISLNAWEELNGDGDRATLDYENEFDYGIMLGGGLAFTEQIGVNVGYYIGLAEFDERMKFNGLIFNLGYNFNGKPSTGIKFGAGPSAKPGSGGKGGIKKPGPTGSSEIDDFVNSAFELNDNLLALKAKLDGVSNGLKESNEIISEIDNHPDGSLGWISNQLVKGTSKAVNNLKTLNISAGLDGLNPAQKLRNVLQALKSGIVDGKDELKTIPNDLESLANDAKNLISSASSLPQAAKSLGMKAPKALVAIKDATNVLKNIPGEASAVGNSAKEVAQEIEQFLQNIENLLKG